MVPAFARAAVVPAARRHGGGVEPADLVMVARLEREMDLGDRSGRQIRHTQVYVVYQPATMELHAHADGTGPLNTASIR